MYEKGTSMRSHQHNKLGGKREVKLESKEKIVHFIRASPLPEKKLLNESTPVQTLHYLQI